jgi:hypothetical protein
MKINRRGWSRDDGTVAINLDRLGIAWDEETRSIKLSSSGVHDFRGNSRHNYDVFLSLDELGAVLGELSSSNIWRDSPSLADGMVKHLRVIMRLAVLSTCGADIVGER